MATAALRHDVDELRESLRELAQQCTRTERSVERLSQEMREFKDEMREFKDETRRERRQMNKQWGDLANRLGTLVEDVVAPNLPRVAAKFLGCPRPSLFAVRVVRRLGEETREYDALLVCDAVVLVNETKSMLLPAHVDAFLAKLEEFPRIFPEYADRRVVGVLASLACDASVVTRATRRGLAVMTMGEETMQVVNPETLSGDATPG